MPARELLQESHRIPLNGEDELHLRRICGDPQGPVIFMLHGAIENGRIFYTDSGKGLAPYLARRGYDVYVADLRGRGKSTPPIGPASRFGQTEAITEDIPAFVERIVDLRGEAPQHWIAHSWGGVLLSSYLARFAEHRHRVRSLVYFGSKRTVRVRNWHRFVQVDLVWLRLCPLLAALFGYLPARMLKLGADSETAKSLRHSLQWVKPLPWVDPDDGFDYGAAARQVRLPPAWFIAAQNDHCLGHPRDVHDFMTEAGQQETRYSILSVRNGQQHDYDHIDMLTHPDASADHFPMVADWLLRYSSV